MKYKVLIGCLLLTAGFLLPVPEAGAVVWTDNYNVSNGFSQAGEGVSTIAFDDWGYAGPDGRTAKQFGPTNGFSANPLDPGGKIGQKQHVATLWRDLLTQDPTHNIVDDMGTALYPNANMDGSTNFYQWGYTSPGYDRGVDPGHNAAYFAGDYSGSTRVGSQFNNMLIDLDGDYYVAKEDMKFGYYDTFSYRDKPDVQPDQEISTTLSFQPYAVSDAEGWCGSVMASHPNAIEPMAGQLKFDFAFDVTYNFAGGGSMPFGTQLAPGFEMRSYGTLNVEVMAGTDLQSFMSEAVVNNTDPTLGRDGSNPLGFTDPAWDNMVSFHGAGVLPDGVWTSADSYVNEDGVTKKLNPEGTWDVTIVPAGTLGAVWHINSFSGYAWILRADGLRMLDGFDASYGLDPTGMATAFIPEPGSMVLVGTGLVGLIGMAGKRRMKR